MGEAFRDVVESLVRAYGGRVVGVVLFGSRARGDYREDSDYDFLVVVDGYVGNDWFYAHEALRPFRVRVGRPTTVLVVSYDDLVRNISFSTLLNAMYDGVILYDRDGRLGRLKRKLVEKLRELGMEKKGDTWTTPKKPTIPFKITLDDPEEYEYRLKLAREHLRTAEATLKENLYHVAVHYAQLSIENSVKALISLYEPPPKKHDVGYLLLKLLNKRGELKKYSKIISEIADIVDRVAPYHTISTYGDAVSFKAPSELFSERDAVELIEKAKQVYNKVRRLISSLLDELGEKHGQRRKLLK